MRAETQPRHHGTRVRVAGVRCQGAPEDAGEAQMLPVALAGGKGWKNGINSPGNPNWMSPAALKITLSSVPRSQILGLLLGSEERKQQAQLGAKGAVVPPASRVHIPGGRNAHL